MNARIASGSPEYMAFKASTEKVGLKLNLSGEAGASTIGAIKKAWNIYQRNGAALYEKTLRLIQRTWNGADWSMQAPILGGVATFISKFPNFNEKRYIQRLSTADMNMLRLGASGISRSRDLAYAVSIARLYNSHGGRNTVNVELLLV